MWNPGLIEPGFVVLPDRIHHEGVALPVADGVAQPGIHHVRIVSTPVHENLAPDVRPAFVYDHDELGSLHDGPGIRRRTHARNTGRQTAGLGIVLAERL